MRRIRHLAVIAVIAAVGLLPASGFAQTPAAPHNQAQTPAQSQAQPAAPAAAAANAAASMHADDTTRVLAIGLGAATGMVMFSAFSTNLISTTALASLGQGIVVFTGTVVGGLLGNWLFVRENH